MSNSYRIRTQVGVDKSINVHLTQDFEFLEILSLKILESEIYTRQCSDYGVVIGRISINNGFGIPNCKVSIFVPLSNQDATNPIISDLYPYTSVSDLNDGGYRYNLLPYVKSYSNHVPTGSFFDKEDVLLNQSYIEVFDKYYKYTAVTNESGDFMIFGVPLGTQTLHVDVDLSDIGEFSLAPQDLIRTGLATETQVAGTKFRSSSNLNELPQIISINRIITVEPLWGQPDVCNIGINRTDFDLSAEANVVIQPTAIFMGSMFSDEDSLALKTNCRPKVKQGELCRLITGPGEILAIRQTIQQDTQGRPILEQYELDGGGQVIDDNGTWLIDLPMNLDYVTTNEFGERVFSNDPEVGIPTRGKYRFKIKWNQGNDLSENVKRGYFLVPNVREYGWNTFFNPILQKKSYAFSLDWDDYADQQTAIDCEDTFYQFSYNKVYTVSQLIDQYRRGTLANRIISIKNILDDTCENENNKFPTNDATLRQDFLYLLYTAFSYIIRPILLALVVVLHVLYVVINFLRFFTPLLAGYFITLGTIAVVESVSVFPAIALFFPIAARALLFYVLGGILIGITVLLFKLKLKPINLPLLLYDQCEFCNCADPSDIEGEDLFDSSNTSGAAPPVLPNVSGLQVTNLEGSFYFADEISDNSNYINFSSILAGRPIQYPPNNTVCYSKTPHFVKGNWIGSNGCNNNNEDPKESIYFSTSLTLAERINLFNTKAKYFNSSTNNPGGGVNRIKVKIAPSLNNPNNSTQKVHYDNVVCLLLTPDSLAAATTGTILSFVNPSISKDINYTGATLNVYGTNSITGSSFFYSNTQINPPTITTTEIEIFYAKPDGTGNISQPIRYRIPIPNSGDTNYHKFPTDIEYFQIITAMTYSQYISQTATVNQLQNNLNSRFLTNNMLVGTLYNGERRYHMNNPITPILGLPDSDNQVIVFLNRGVDPYSSRVETKYYLGKLFGYTNEDAVQITGMTKLNIPIQGRFLNVNHNTLISNTNTNNDSYSNMSLYYNSFDYVPSLDYSSFTSNNLQYYSQLRNNVNTAPSINCGSITNCDTNNRIQNDSIYGIKIWSNSNALGIDNHFTKEFRGFADNATGLCTRELELNTSLNNRGYFPGEIIEGASSMSARYQYLDYNRTDDIVFIYNTDFKKDSRPILKSSYYAPKYSTGLTVTFTTGSSGRQIVMRSDRLPTSDRLLRNCNNYFSLQQNQNLGIYVIPDTGAVGVEGGGLLGQPELDEDDLPPNQTAELIRSTNSCADSRNLECYLFTPNGAIQNGLLYPGGGIYNVDSGNCQRIGGTGKIFFENGCYKLITTPLVSLPKDLLIVSEWFSRLNIAFGACRNVFSHLFTQNWINGSLYAFAFKNIKLFDNDGNITPQYCNSVIFFDDDTNNFYYRSSPYRTGTTINGFVGQNAPTLPNENNLLYPTTIMDLGPRTDYIQELVFSDEYDGYVVNRLKSTTYQDVTELLNLLIISRLANTNFIELMIGSDGASILEYFTRVPLFNSQQRRHIDADYAQMISINSELGVVPFEAENYPTAQIPGLTPPTTFNIDPVYFNTGEKNDVIFGIFYSSDTQLRDYITPKRTIIDSQVMLDNDCAFNNFYCYSQEVPFYQWEIKDNLNDPPPNTSIFGSQRNDWYTKPINGSLFHSHKYQSLDRADSLSRYFRSSNPNLFTDDFKGYIYSINRSNPQPYWTNPSLDPLGISWQRNNPDFNTVTVGAPFYFYFGLKKGKSAWDRFAKKWINFENIR